MMIRAWRLRRDHEVIESSNYPYVVGWFALNIRVNPKAYLQLIPSELFIVTPFPCPFSVLAIALFIYYTSVPTETEVK